MQEVVTINIKGREMTLYTNSVIRVATIMGINKLSSIYLELIKSSDMVEIMDIINEVINPKSNKKSIIKQEEKNANVPSSVF